MVTAYTNFPLSEPHRHGSFSVRVGKVEHSQGFII